MMSNLSPSTSAIKLLSHDIKKHPEFGASYNAKNKDVKTYTLGDLTIRFIKEEWYAEGDTDAEFWIEIGPTRKSPFSQPEEPLHFDMFPDEPWSRMSMSRGRYGDQIALLVTTMEEEEGDVDSKRKYKAKKAVIEEGSASEMNKEWITLAGLSKLSVDEFTDCLIDEFGMWWFSGMYLLPKLALAARR